MKKLQRYSVEKINDAQPRTTYFMCKDADVAALEAEAEWFLDTEWFLDKWMKVIDYNNKEQAHIQALEAENERLLSYAQYIPCICSAVSLAMVPPNYHSNCKRHSFLNREQEKQP